MEKGEGAISCMKTGNKISKKCLGRNSTIMEDLNEKDQGENEFQFVRDIKDDKRRLCEGIRNKKKATEVIGN